MGLRMDDIHTPTVPSGPTTQVVLNATTSDKTSLLGLMAEKDRVEAELSALSGVLDSHGVNMNTSLTTFDGYPRDDLDIAQIRTTRARIIHLRNDYKALMARIETGLHAHHAAAQAAQSQPVPAPMATPTVHGGSNATDANLIETPFAIVNSVVSGSPAEGAGLKAGDRIRNFGGINWLNHERLSQVATTVHRNEGHSIEVRILRITSEGGLSQEMQLQLVPRRDWGGRGLLGCHLLPA